MSKRYFMALICGILTTHAFAQTIFRCGRGSSNESFSIGSFSVFQSVSSDLMIEDHECYQLGKMHGQTLAHNRLPHCQETMLDTYETAKYNVNVNIKLPTQCAHIGLHFARASLVQGARLGIYSLTTPKCVAGYRDALNDVRTGSGYNRVLSSIYDYCYNAARFEALPTYNQ